METPEKTPESDFDDWGDECDEMLAEIRLTPLLQRKTLENTPTKESPSALGAERGGAESGAGAESGGSERGAGTSAPDSQRTVSYVASLLVT